MDSHYISRIKIDGFRNIATLDAELCPSFNVFYGNNGSGKTSLLEAIYYLAFGRSFRTSLTSRIVQHHKDSLSVFVEVSGGEQTHQIGIEWSNSHKKRLKLDGDKLLSMAPIAQLLPVQLISVDSYRYFHEGPKVRRQFLDWGLFHVKPSFFPTWQTLQQGLKQRNAALKQRATAHEVHIWNDIFVPAATTIDTMRQEYVTQIQPILNTLLASLLPNIELSLRYQRGWSAGQDLTLLLENQLHRDMQLGYTQSGPHRADCQLYFNNTPVQDVLSQGQQKLASYALLLAQGILLHQLTSRSPIYLIDDLPSELDPDKRACITESLATLSAQVFITGITLQDLEEISTLPNHAMFHVKQTDGQGIIVPRETSPAY